MIVRQPLYAAMLGSLLLLSACASSQRPSGDAPAPPQLEADSGVAILRCGSLPVRTTFNADQLTLEAGSAKYLLERVRSGSGAKYEMPGDSSTSYWLKGDKGMLVLKGQPYPECEPAGALLLQAGEWVVESINQNDILDGSRATLNFGNDGRVSGMASCNNYAGAYNVAGSSLTVSQLVSTRMACQPGFGEQETRFLQTLENISRFELNSKGALVLKTDSGDSLTARLQ
ncbi:MAG: META domain-containing protein [Halopseudomonas sp.]|uniref:META domain-containing protein n=1 Tax=Halopseudomonas sp. TaxID=2901191 RepID=UPI00300318C2